MSHHSNVLVALLDVLIGVTLGVLGYAARVVDENIDIWKDVRGTIIHAIIAALIGATLTFFVTKFWKWLWLKIFKK